jgi:hypothetical protein
MMKALVEFSIDDLRVLVMVKLAGRRGCRVKMGGGPEVFEDWLGTCAPWLVMPDHVSPAARAPDRACADNQHADSICHGPADPCGSLLPAPSRIAGYGLTRQFNAPSPG